jgi:hypothetical protein
MFMTPNKYTMKIYFMITTELTFIAGLWLKPAMIGPTDSDIGACRGPRIYVVLAAEREKEREQRSGVGERRGGGKTI